MVVDRADVDARSRGQADLVFHALADATRRDIVAEVLRTDRSVSQLARRYPMSFAAVQKHVAVLERAGLVVKTRRGREQRVTGSPDTLRRAQELLDQFASIWRQRIDSIDEILVEPTRGEY